MQVQMIEKARANRVSALYCLTAKNTAAVRAGSPARLVLVPSDRRKEGKLPGAFGIFKSHRSWRERDAKLVDFPQPAV